MRSAALRTSRISVVQAILYEQQVCFASELLMIALVVFGCIICAFALRFCPALALCFTLCLFFCLICLLCKVFPRLVPYQPVALLSPALCCAHYS